MIVGGPEPADGGRLNVIRYVVPYLLLLRTNLSHSIHAGTTTGGVNATFGASERAAFKQSIVPLFGKFLKKCYSKWSLLVYFYPMSNGSSSQLWKIADREPYHLRQASSPKSPLKYQNW